MWMEFWGMVHALLETVCVSPRQLERRWSHSLPIARLCEYIWGASHPAGTLAQVAAVLTISSVYMQTFRLTLTTRMVQAPRRGWSLSYFLDRVAGSGSMAGSPRIQSLSRVGTPRGAALPPPNEPDDSLLGASFQQTKASRTWSIALVAQRYSR